MKYALCYPECAAGAEQAGLIINADFVPAGRASCEHARVSAYTAEQNRAQLVKGL